MPVIQGCVCGKHFVKFCWDVALWERGEHSRVSKEGQSVETSGGLVGWGWGRQRVQAWEGTEASTPAENPAGKGFNDSPPSPAQVVFFFYREVFLDSEHIHAYF